MLTARRASAAADARLAGVRPLGRLRVAVALTVVGLGAAPRPRIVLRGIAAGRVPWANMYEFAMTGTARHGRRLPDRATSGATCGSSAPSSPASCSFLLGLATVNFYVAVVPLPPALQSAWLVIHVFVAILGTGVLRPRLRAVGRAAAAGPARSAAADAPGDSRSSRTLPSSEKLENLAYRVNIVGFILWTFTLMAGAIWAERAWGRYWGWDTKEVWTFIIWVIYAGYIHARATRGWRGSRSAWLAIIGFSAVMFNFTVVNLFFKGLHAYSGL